MSKKAQAFTDISIRNLKPSAKRREIPDPGARGLYLVVQPSGMKSFAVRYRFRGWPRKLTLQAGIGLAAARKEAGTALYEVEQGRDPAIEKRKAKQELLKEAENTFRAIGDDYLRRECGMQVDAEGNVTFKADKLRTGSQRLATLKRLVYPTLGDTPISQIRRSDIIKLLDKIEDGDLRSPDGETIAGGAVMADRTLALIRKIMNWHATRSDDFASPIVRGMARVNPKERKRKRTLTDDELRAVWRAAEEGTGPFDRLVQFLLLNAARRDEAAKMKRSELVGADWTLPAARNKAKVDLIRPLSNAAQRVLERTPKIADSEFIFSTNGKSPISGYSRFKRDFDKRAGITGWTLHDLRRTARSLMSRTGVVSDHAEMCLGHVIGGVRETYDRYEYHAEKKAALAALAGQIDRIVNRRENVVSIGAARV